MYTSISSLAKFNSPSLILFPDNQKSLKNSLTSKDPQKNHPMNSHRQANLILVPSIISRNI